MCEISLKTKPNNIWYLNETLMIPVIITDLYPKRDIKGMYCSGLIGITWIYYN